MAKKQIDEEKTLTEQWRDGTLKTGSYYIRTITGNEKSDYFEGKKFCFWSDYEVEEVLAPVPSYDEWHKVKDLGLRPDYTDHIEKWEDCARLTKQLSIATKALKNAHKFPSTMSLKEYCEQALKEIKGVR